MASNGSGKEIEIQVSPLVSEDGIKKFKTDLQSKLDNATKGIAVTIKPTVDLTEVKNSLKTIYTDADTTTGITLRKVGLSIMSWGAIKKALQETIPQLKVETSINLKPTSINVEGLDKAVTLGNNPVEVTLPSVALSAESKTNIKSAIESYLGTATITSPLTINPDSVTIDKDAIAKSLANLNVSIPTLSLSSDRVTMTSDEVAKIKGYLDERLQGIRFNAHLAVPDVNLSEMDGSLRKFFDEHTYPLNFDEKDLAATETALDTTFKGVAQRLRNQVSDALYGTVDYVLKNKTIPVTVKIRPDKEYSNDMKSIKEDIKNQIESGIDFTVKEVKYKPKDVSDALKNDWTNVVVPAVKVSTFEVNLSALNKAVSDKFSEMTVPSVLISSAHFKDDKVLSELETSINGYLADKSFALKPKIDFQFDTDKETPEKKVKKDVFDRLESYIQSRKVGVPIDVDATIDSASSKKAAETISKFAGSLKRAVQFTITTKPDIDTLKSNIDTATADRTTTVKFKVSPEADYKTQYAAIKQTDTHKIKLEIENQQDIQNKLDAIQAGKYSAKLFLDTTELDTKIASLEKGSLYKVVPTFWYDNTRGKSALDALKGEAAAILGTWQIPFNVYPKFNETKLSDLKNTVSDLYGKRQLSITTDLDKEAYRSTKDAIDSLFKDASTPVQSQLEVVQKLVDKTYAQMVKLAQDSIKEGAKQTESEKKRRKEVHNQTMADIKKEDAEARATFASRISTEKSLRENQAETTLRNIERERSAYKDVLTDLGKFKLNESVGADLVNKFKEIKGTLSTEVEKANHGLEDAISLNQKNYLESVQKENAYYELRKSNLEKVRDKQLSYVGATSLEERNSIIEYYTEREMKEARAHEERLSTLNKELEVSNSNSKIESTKAIAAAEEVASTRFSLFQAEYNTRLANADALKAKEIADAKEIASKRESFLEQRKGEVERGKIQSDATAAQDSAKLQQQLSSFYSTYKHMDAEKDIKDEISLQSELNNLILDANTKRQLGLVQLSNESDAVKAIKTEYINLFAEEQKGYEKKIAKENESYRLDKLHAENLKQIAIDKAEKDKQEAIAAAVKKRAEGYADLEERLKNIRETLEKDPTTNTDGFVKSFKQSIKDINSEYKQALVQAGAAFNEAVEEAERTLTEGEKKRTSSHKKNITNIKLEHEEQVRSNEAERKGKLDNQISAEKAEAELTARKESNLKYIANLESKFIEERKSKELSAQNEVLEAERKKRAEEHASRLAEIKEETDAYKASVESRTKERVSGYLSESDLGVIKGTDSLSKTKDRISSIRDAISEGLKGADECEKKWSDVYSKIANKGRENAEKVYSKRIENINGEEKTKLESLQSILLHELEMNSDISHDEREKIVKYYSNQMKSVSEAAEKDRNSAKETLEQRLRNLETYEAKAKASVSRITVDKKASTEETKAAEISAIIEEYNKRKAHIDAQLSWLNKYFDLEKKRIDENSTYRRNKAKLDAEYEEGLRRAQSEYNTKVYQGTSLAETDLAIKKANIRSEAKLEQDSIFSSNDIDDIKLLKSTLVDAKAEIKEMAAEEESSLKTYYFKKSAEQARFHAQAVNDINNELEQGKQAIDTKYAKELDALQKKEDSLRKSLSMEKEGTISWNELKKSAEEIVTKREQLLHTIEDEKKELDTLAKTKRDTEDEHYNKVVADTNSEKDIALNAVGTVSKELIAEEEKKTNKAIENIHKEEETRKEEAKKSQEEIARTRKEALDTYYALFEELEKRFQDLLKQRLDIIRAQNKEEIKGLETAFEYSRKQADIKRKGTNRTEDIYSKYTFQMKDDRARLQEKVAEDIAKINASSLDEEEKKKQISYVKDMARAEFKHNNEVRRIYKRQDIMNSLAETAYDNAVAKAENISDIEMQDEEKRHSKRMDDLKNEIKVLEGKRGTMSDEDYSSQMIAIEELIAEENKLHQEKEHNRKTALEKSKQDAEDDLRDAKRTSKEKAQDKLNALNTKYNARKREKEQEETLRREENSKTLKEREDLNNQLMNAIAKFKENREKVWDSERAEKEKQAKAEAEATEKALAHETDVYKKELNEQLEAKRRNQKFKSEYENQVNSGKDTYNDTLKTIDTSQERKKLEEENKTRIELEKELARIRESSASEEDKRKKESEAREKVAEENKHNTILRNIETQRAKRLAFIELYKGASIAAENKTHEKALADIADRKSKDLAAIAEEEYQLEQSKDKLTAEEYNNQKKELEARKKAIEEAYDLEIKKEDESHNKKLRNINSRTKAATSSIELSATKKSTAEDLRYARATTDGLSPEKDITKSKANITKYTDVIKEQTSKLMSLFQKGAKLVWTNYTKYGKSSIQTISNLFKSTLQKTFQGSKKLNEVLGLSKGTSEVDSVTQALSKLKSQLLGIAGISISFKTILGTTEASSELVEIQNVVSTTFGDVLEKEVNDFASNASRAFGLTEYQAKRFISIFGSMFKTSGVSVEASKEMGESLTALSADLASFFDADFTEAFDKVKSGLSGMIMPLRAYGIDLSVASMKQYMLDKGLQATWADLSIAQKQMVRYNYMLEKTQDMQGDFHKTMGTWANQFRLLKNQFRELAVIAGSAVEKVIYPMIVALNKLLGILVKVGTELQKTFGFTSGDLDDQQNGKNKVKRGTDIGVTYDDASDTSDAVDATDDLTASTDKLTESKKKLQKENERQEASFDSLIKLSKQSTDATDASTKSNKDKSKKKGTGADLDLDPLKYKGLDLSKAELKLPKWAQRIVKWGNEVKALFDKYKKRLTKGFKELKKAWEPVLDKLGDAIDWLWKNILKPFLEWLLGTAIPKTMELLTALGGVVDSVLTPIGEAAKELWKEVLEPFFKAIGNKYVKWVEESTEKLKEWKKQFDELDTVEEKLDFLKQSIKNWFEDTMQKLFGDRSKEILDNFYSMWDSIKGVLHGVFAGTDEIANGKLFSDDFIEAVKNLAGAFVQLASTHFDNLLGLADTLAQNEVPLSEIAANLADNFGKIETMVFDGIKGFIDMLGEHSDEVQDVADALTDLITTIGATVFTGLTNTVEKLLETGVAADYLEIIKNFLNDIAKIVFKNVDELIDWLSDEDVKARVQDIANSLERTFNNITTFLSDHKDDILTLVDKIVKFVEFASEHPDVVIGMFGTLLANKGLAAVIKTPLGGLLKEGGTFVLEKIKGFLPKIGATIISGITSLVAPIAAAVGLPVSAVIAIIAAGIAAIVAIVLNWDKIKEFFTKTVPNFFKEKVKPWLNKIGEKLKAFVESIPDKIHDGVVAAAEKFGELLGKWYTFCTKKLPEILEYIGNWFLNLPDKIEKWWKGTKKAWKEGFQYLVDTVPGLVKDIYDKFKENFDSYVTFWTNLGKNIIDGIGDGIKNGISWIGDLAEDAANAFLGGFRKKAEIHSPSKKARILGEFLMKGLGNGVKNGMSDVLAQFNKVYEGTDNFISTLKDTFTNLQMSTLTSNLVAALDSMTLDAMEQAKQRDLSSLFTSDATMAKAVRAKAVVNFDRSLGVSPLSSYTNKVSGRAYREANQDLVDNLTDSMMMALQDAGMFEKEQGTRKATVNVYLDSERIATKVIDIADSKAVRSGGL